MAHPVVSITLMPHIRDDVDGWYVILADQRQAGPFTEDEASEALRRMLDG